jgi:hypothetical protein
MLLYTQRGTFTIQHKESVMLSYNILPCLIALVGGIALGTLSRPLASYMSKTTIMTEEQSRGCVLHSAKKVCLGLLIIVVLITFTKNAFSYGTVIISMYFIFLIFTILWGILMGLVQCFVSSGHAIKILRKI